jgi:hypothetical protein
MSPELLQGKQSEPRRRGPESIFLIESIQIVYMNVKANSFHLDATASDRHSVFRIAISAPGANCGYE